MPKQTSGMWKMKDIACISLAQSRFSWSASPGAPKVSAATSGGPRHGGIYPAPPWRFYEREPDFLRLDPALRRPEPEDELRLRLEDDLPRLRDEDPG